MVDNLHANSYKSLYTSAQSANRILPMSSSGTCPRNSGAHPIERVSRRRWVEAIRRLTHGHTYRGQGSPAAAVNAIGCVLPHKAANRAVCGYIQVAPAPALGLGESREETVAPQLAHRVVCFLNCEAGQVTRMLYQGLQASHLCGNERCINAQHLVIETREENEARKACSNKVDVYTRVGEQLYVLRAESCPHGPRHCIFRKEMRDAVKQEE